MKRKWKVIIGVVVVLLLGVGVYASSVMSKKGLVTVQTGNDLWGVEGNLRHNLCGGCGWNVDFLWGFRFISLIEDRARLA